MNGRILYRILLGTCLAVAVGGLAAQTPATSDEGSSTNASAQKQNPAKQEQNAQPKHPQAKKPSHHTAKAKSPAHTASAKSPSHQTKAKSPQHMAKAKTEESWTPDEQAYRQALRGCVTQKDESQRDSCLDEAIQKFNRDA